MNGNSTLFLFSANSAPWRYPFFFLSLWKGEILTVHEEIWSFTMLSRDGLKCSCCTFVLFPRLGGLSLGPSVLWCFGSVVVFSGFELFFCDILSLRHPLYSYVIFDESFVTLEELPLKDLSWSMLALQREMHIWHKTNMLLSFHWILLEYKKASVQLLSSESSLCTLSWYYLPEMIRTSQSLLLLL